MRIAYLCSDPGVPVFGTKGASIHVRELTRALQGAGHDVTVLATRTGGDPADDHDVPVIGFEPERSDARLLSLLRNEHRAARDVRSIVAALTLRERALPVLRTLAPDLIYERYSLFGTAGTAIASELGVPLVLEVNAPLSEEQERHRSLAFPATAREVEHTVLRAADRVVVVSSALERWAVAAGVPRDRLTVMPNAVDTARFQNADGTAVRAELGLSDRPVIGFLGSLKPWHDVATLIRAVAMVGRPAHLLVAGDGPERARLQELARSEGVPATFTGAVPYDAVPSYLAAFDVAVVPYREDEMYFSPIKMFEYLAAALPVVAADAGDIGRCIQHGSTGLLYRPGDAHSLSEAIGALLTDPARASTIGSAGRAHVRAHHTWESNAHRVLGRTERIHAGVPA